MENFDDFVEILVIRVSFCFIIEPWHLKGEHLDSLEVAHLWTFGYGYLTWPWSEGIYSSVHPLSIAALYKALAWVGLDRVDYLVMVPRFFQALLTTYSDYCFYRWSNNNQWSLLLILTSWFWFLLATLTIICTVEICLTTIALRFYPRQYDANTCTFIWIISFLIMIQPKAAILWFPLCVFHIQRHIRSVGEFIKAYILIPLVVGTIIVGIDSYVYGRFIVTPLNHFKTIVSENFENLPLCWYFSIGLPVILGHVTIPFVIAAFETVRFNDVYHERFILLIAILFTLGIYSFYPEQKIRYFLSLLPLCLHITGDALKIWTRKLDQHQACIIACMIFLFNAVAIVLFILEFPRGSVDIMIPIEQIAREYRTPDGHRAKFLLLMPCYSTPLYSHVHQNVTLRFLTCEPNLNGEKDYIDEEEQFYANPAEWLQYNVTDYQKSRLPTHTVLFDSLEPEIEDFLKDYKLIHNVSNKNIFNISRIGQNILLYERLVDAPTCRITEKPNHKKVL